MGAFRFVFVGRLTWATTNTTFSCGGEKAKALQFLVVLQEVDNEKQLKSSGSVGI